MNVMNTFIKLIKKILNLFGYKLNKVSKIKILNDDFLFAIKDYLNNEPILFDIGANNGQTVSKFKKAFTEDDKVKLVVKTINGKLWPAQKKLLFQAAKGFPNILIFDQYLDRAEVLGLISGALAYVSLHRSEGYGLTLSESMELGTPVIATGYSGNMDFMNQSNSMLVDFDLVEVFDTSGAYHLQSRWAQPKVDSAARQMRRIFDDPRLAAEIARAAKHSIENDFQLSLTVEFIEERVAVVTSTSSLVFFKRCLSLLRRRIARVTPTRVKNIIRRYM
jgi:glycosyltransferase involved in cell wall biosynthesis